MIEYFTKFLPEGEIEENNGYFKTKYIEGVTEVSEKEYYNNGGDEINLVGKIENDKVFVRNTGSWYYLKEITPVRLFLCTRDIQVGDRGFNTVKNEYFICNEIGTGMYFSKTEGEYFSIAQLKENCLKVVREVTDLNPII